VPAHFEKVKVPPLNEFDGFDPKVMYQMVPVGEARAMAVVTDNDECTIIVDPPGIARMQKFVFAKPLLEVPREFRARVTRQNRITFEIFGITTGNTTIFLVDPQGKGITALLVSVKAKITKTAALCRLSDMKRNSPWASERLPAIQTADSRVFSQQANIAFTQHRSVFDVTVPSNLGDPLILDKGTARATIIGVTPNAAFGANFIVYFTWDLFSVKGQIVGQNFGTDCYVEFDSNTFEQGVTAAHELGHGLGLSHTGAQLLMAGDGVSRSSLLQQFEIDTINQTDASP
jgi:hypothetical protein